MTPYELARRSVWIFAKAVDYCSEEEIQSGEANIHARIERADLLIAMLDDWLNNLPVEFGPIPKQPSDACHDFQPLWIHPPAFGKPRSLMESRAYLLIFQGVSMQFHYSARILILLHKPSLGGLPGHIVRQKRLKEAVDTICGIALALSDAASSLVSSQCRFIGILRPMKQLHDRC